MIEIVIAFSPILWQRGADFCNKKQATCIVKCKGWKLFYIIKKRIRLDSLLLMFGDTQVDFDVINWPVI